MCGIVGIYSYKKKVEPKWIRLATDLISHRGPDDEGFLAVNTKTKEIIPLVGNNSKINGFHIDSFNNYADLFLGHKRLSIIDISPLGHQPFSNKDKTLWIIFNGEIYNYIELKEELKKLGYSFKSKSDTEVLLTAYEAWGEKCLNKLNGMWAFVIYDLRKNILFGSRDRFGVKPFYYYLDKDFFAFASEIKALVKLPFIKTKINRKAAFDYLVLGLEENNDESLFKNIYELKPSYSFKFYLDSNQLKKWKYYNLNYNNKWEKFDHEKASKYILKIKELIFNAISLRLRSDVPVGTCLSGGIDSSTIVCVINKLLEKEKLSQIGNIQKVFTASYKNSQIDESHWAEKVIKYTKTSWHKTFPTSDELLEDLEDLIYSQDIPFGSTSVYAQYRVMRLAKQNNVKVLLDGQGGDELFTGYTTYYNTYFIEMLKNLSLKNFFHEIIMLNNSPVDIKTLITYLVKYGIRKIIPKKIIHNFIITKKIENSYINQEFFKDNKDEVKTFVESEFSSLNEMLLRYMNEMSLKSLLRYEDRNSMWFSIESRTPFADDIELIEYLFSIPSAYKIYNGWSKYLLREAMDGILPNEIKYRKDKIGFATPQFSWLSKLKNELKQYFTDDLKDILDINNLLRDLDKINASQTRYEVTNIWKCINFAIWKKLYRI